MSILKSFLFVFHITFAICGDICHLNRECTNENKQILFYSKHEGTSNEMTAILAKRTYNYKIEILKPISLTKNFDQTKNLTIPHHLAEQLFLSDDFFKRACNKFDLIIMSDVLSLGRPFFQASPKKCKSKILLQVTTRFDWGHFQDANFTLLFKRMVKTA